VIGSSITVRSQSSVHGDGLDAPAIDAIRLTIWGKRTAGNHRSITNTACDVWQYMDAGRGQKREILDRKHR
jgi:hypothetical protein